MGSIEIFISYAPEDEKLREELAKHLSVLKTQGRITIWYNDKIAPGLNRQIEVDKHFDEAQIHLLLISADFLASEYCDYITQRAMKRHKHYGVCVIPIHLRPVYWQDAPFAKLSMLPKNAKPITTYPNQDEAMLETVEGILEIAKEFFSNNIDSSSTNSLAIPTQITFTYGPSQEGNKGVASFLLHGQEHIVHYTRIDSIKSFLDQRNLARLKNQTILLTHNQTELVREEVPELAPLRTLVKQRNFQIAGVDFQFTFKMSAFTGIMSARLEAGNVKIFSF